MVLFSPGWIVWVLLVPVASSVVQVLVAESVVLHSALRFGPLVSCPLGCPLVPVCEVGVGPVRHPDLDVSHYQKGLPALGRRLMVTIFQNRLDFCAHSSTPAFWAGSSETVSSAEVSDSASPL